MVIIMRIILSDKTNFLMLHCLYIVKQEMLGSTSPFSTGMLWYFNSIYGSRGNNNLIGSS